LRRLLLIGLISSGASLATAATGDAEQRGVSFGPVPSWVDRIAPSLVPSPDASEISDGVHYLLVDEQIRVGAGPEARFRHFAKRIVNEAGLEASSQLSVSYDPTYQSAHLHFVRIHRAGRSLDRLDPSAIQIVQRETELESQIFDGRLSAVLFIEDLRAGDVLEYAYTLRGANPVLGGRFADAFDVEWSRPLRRQHFRLVWPHGRSLYVRGHGTSIAPVIREKGPWREYVWELDESAPVDDPGDVPPWFPRWAWVQLSEWEDWSEIAEWARQLYRVPALSRAVADQAAQWRQLPDAVARARAALRFVQDEVRYVGIELGSGSHRPSPPEVVLSRRFGDCKDKTLLLVTLLRALGITAQPALVHTTRGAALDDWLPSPFAFDHVVTRVVVDGRTLWVDPTRSAQGGSFETTHFAALERALVVGESIEELTEIPIVVPAQPTTTVREEYRVVDETAPVAFTVVTRYESGDADSMRYRLRRDSHQDVESRYLRYYAQSWPEIRSAAPIEIQDDREVNVIVVREQYAIPDFWGEGSASQTLESELWASTLSAELTRPTIASHAPLAVAHPVFLRHVTLVDLPGDWGFEPATVEVRSPAASFSYVARPREDSITLEYEYRSLAPVVPVGSVDDHAAKVDEMASHLAFVLRRPTGARLSGTNWVAILTLVLGGALAGTGSAAFARIVPERRPRSRRRRLSGGFLGVLLVGGIVVQGEGLMRAWHLCRPGSWAQRTLPNGTLYHPLWEPFLLSHLVVAVILLTAAVLLLLLFSSGNERGRVAFVFWAFAQTGLLFAAAAALASLPGARGSGLAEATRGALFSLLPLVPGSAAALVSSRTALQRGVVSVSSIRRPRES